MKLHPNILPGDGRVKRRRWFIQLPANVKSDKIDASFDKGVLKITLPKTDEAKKKEIKINVK
jgi:HSP20 family molecular chaperone IbpA